MAITLPFGVRIAAGLLATTFDRLVALPKELPALGVSLAGQAVRSSFRLQQELAELATRGDELLAGITGRPEEHPAWATFDEDEDSDPAPADGDATTDGSEATDEATETDDATDGPPAGTGASPSASPMPIHGDHLLSIAELKDQLVDLDIASVRELLILEQAGPARAAYLTLLENRLTTLDHQNGQP